MMTHLVKTLKWWPIWSSRTWRELRKIMNHVPLPHYPPPSSIIGGGSPLVVAYRCSVGRSRWYRTVPGQSSGRRPCCRVHSPCSRYPHQHVERWRTPWQIQSGFWSCCYPKMQNSPPGRWSQAWTHILELIKSNIKFLVGNGKYMWKDSKWYRPLQSS